MALWFGGVGKALVGRLDADGVVLMVLAALDAPPKNDRLRSEGR